MLNNIVVGKAVVVEVCVGINRQKMTFRGTVISNPSWLSDHRYFCITTDMPDLPFRSIVLNDVISVNGAANTALPETAANKPKIRTWEVKSGTSGNKYIVRLVNGRFECNCVAGTFGRECKHVKSVQQVIK